MDIISHDEPGFSIPLTRGLSALVSPEDYPLVSQFKWYAMKTKGKFYAVRKSPMINGGKRNQILVHRFLLGLEVGDKRQGDHANNVDTLDNRRSNIRIAAHVENCWNTTHKRYNKLGLKGVSVDMKAHPSHRYRARITIKGKDIRLGSYPTPELAHERYKQAALENFGAFARSA